MQNVQMETRLIKRDNVEDKTEIDENEIDKM